MVPAGAWRCKGRPDGLRRRGSVWVFRLDYPNAAAIFREHARLSSFENEGSRDFDLAALNTLDDRAFTMRLP